MLFQSKIQPLHDLNGLFCIQANAEGYRYPVHFHDTFVIELVQEGADWCDAREQLAVAGDVFFHFPYSAHSGGNHQQSPLRYTAIYPSVSLMLDTGFSIEAEQLVADSLVLRDPELTHVTASLLRSAASGDERQVVRRLCEFNQLAMDSLLANHGVENAMGLNEPIRRARRYLDDHYARDIQVAELSEAIGMSRFHLIRQFRKCLGITPRQYLISRRVAKATELLKRGQSIASVAYATGFFDQSHLTRCFRRVNGFLPSQILLLDTH